MFKAILEYENNGHKVSRPKLKELMKQINVLGGSYLLDFYSEEEIKEKCLKILSNMNF